MMKTIKYFFEAILIYFFFILSKIIGLNLSRKIFSNVFLIFGPIFKSKEIINQNLFRFSKDLTNEQKKLIESNMWKNYGLTFVEYIFLNRFRKSSSHIEVKGEKILEEISKNKKPVVFISGHFANFELMSMEITKRQINLATIYRPLNNFFLNPFMEFLRKKYVCKNQIKKGVKGVKESIQFINEGNSLALMIDQRVSEGEKIEFFNQESFTTTLPAQIALKYDLKIVPIFIERNVDNFFKMEVMNPIEISKFKDKIHISKYLNKILEDMIKRNPNQWIWTHNRWK